MHISQSAFDLIVREEVSSQAFYERHYQSPEWPGGMSGVTIGVGYDLGYASIEKITADWSKHVGATMLAHMCQCAGVRGDAAKALLPKVKNLITIPWSAAIEVFTRRDVPQWTAAVIARIPAASRLSATCLGAQVSLAYNRGAAGYDLPGDRYTEMRFIKQRIQHGDLRPVADDIRAMKRLWPSLKGLRARRDHEAALWEAGLSEPAGSQEALPSVDPSIPLRPGAARTKPPVSTKGQHATTAVIVAGGAALAQQAHAHGLVSRDVAMFSGFLALLAGITVWVMWYRRRNPA